MDDPGFIALFREIDNKHFHYDTLTGTQGPHCPCDDTRIINTLIVKPALQLRLHNINQTFYTLACKLLSKYQEQCENDVFYFNVHNITTDVIRTFKPEYQIEGNKKLTRQKEIDAKITEHLEALSDLGYIVWDSSTTYPQDSIVPCEWYLVETKEDWSYASMIINFVRDGEFHNMLRRIDKCTI